MILVFEKHPVQYRAPLYAEIERLEPNQIHVIYKSIESTKGYKDKEFGEKVNWDVPLLEGYPYSTLEESRSSTIALAKYVLNKEVSAVYLTGYSAMHILAGLTALLLGKQVSIRTETQDYAFPRSPLKSFLRSILYNVIYTPISRAFHIGSLNRKHYLNHGFCERQLYWMPYIVSDPIAKLTKAEKGDIRQKTRKHLAVDSEVKIVGFFGKLIPKKNPKLLLEGFLQLPQSDRSNVHILFVGSGEEEVELKAFAKEHQIPCTFTGFVNQSQIHDYYLSTDVMCLPSRQMGETWGLVVNEGLQAGNATLISNYVGSSADFGEWERVKVFESENVNDYASKLSELLSYTHDFDWCEKEMRTQYSIHATAKLFLDSLTSSNGFFPSEKSLSL